MILRRVRIGHGAGRRSDIRSEKVDDLLVPDSDPGPRAAPVRIGIACGLVLVSQWRAGSHGYTVTGDAVRLVAGCDRCAKTCREKFENFINFRGFPHIPGEDWLMSYPTSSGVNDGGSLKR